MPGKLSRTSFAAFVLPAVLILGVLGCQSEGPVSSLDSSDGLALAGHDPGHVIVHPGDMAGWVFVTESTPGGQFGDLVTGPASPPLGDGSVRLVLTGGGEGMTLQRGGYTGVPFASLTELSYCTYVSSAPGPQAVSLQINVDDDVTDGDTGWKGRLAFEPYQQGTPPAADTWQCWNALDGDWWASGSPINGIAPQSDPQSLATILATYPDAGFNSSGGGILFKAGSGWSSFDGNADALTIAGTTIPRTIFDFEAEAPQPATKADCKKGGWKQYGFKNQGQCIRYVNTGKDSR